MKFGNFVVVNGMTNEIMIIVHAVKKTNKNN
jgi:hypothetical protein